MPYYHIWSVVKNCFWMTITFKMGPSHLLFFLVIGRTAFGLNCFEVRNFWTIYYFFPNNSLIYSCFNLSIVWRWKIRPDRECRPAFCLYFCKFFFQKVMIKNCVSLFTWIKNNYRRSILMTLSFGLVLPPPKCTPNSIFFNFAWRTAVIGEKSQKYFKNSWKFHFAISASKFDKISKPLFSIEE